MKIEKNLEKVCGIYVIVNTINNKKYVGSSINMYNRAYTYKCLAKKGKIHNKHLQSAICKYGINAFEFKKLEIIKLTPNLSNTDINTLIINREQFYISLFKPEYNARKVVDRNLGLKCTENTKKKISDSLKKAFLSGKKKINRIYSHNIFVSLYTLDGILIKQFDGLAQCAEHLDVTFQSVKYALTSKRRVCKNHIVLLRTEELDIQNYVGIPINTSTYSKKVSLLDIKTNKIVVYNTVKEVATLLSCKSETIKKYSENGKLIMGQYFVSYIT